MRKSVIPNFLFYPNIDKSEVIKSAFFLLKKKKNEINMVKKNVSKFFSLNNFTLIYFYIGNFFIKNKLSKTLKNLVYIDNNYYVLSNENLNFTDNLNKFINDIEKIKKYSVNKVILYLNNKYYLPSDILSLSYFYFLFFTVFLLNFKLNLVYFNLNILNMFNILQKKLIK